MVFRNRFNFFYITFIMFVTPTEKSFFVALSHFCILQRWTCSEFHKCVWPSNHNWVVNIMTDDWGYKIKVESSHKKNLSSQLGISYNTIQPLRQITSIITLISMYFANFHLHLRYGIFIFKGKEGVTRTVKQFKKNDSYKSNL